MYDLIIIGAGPAGLTAALYAGRYRLKALVLEKMGIGGQIILSDTIENFPGFPGGISTQELMERIKKQVDELGVAIEIAECLEIVATTRPVFTIKTKDRSYETKSVIIASGASPMKLGVKGEARLVGRGVSYCGTCDGPLFKNKEIVVAGAGDRAIEEALFLSSYAKRVTIIHRRNQLRASKILEEKTRKNSKINFILESVIEEIMGQNKVEAIRIKNVKTDSVSVFPSSGVFVFIGIVPNTSFIKNQLNTDELGFIIDGEDLMTSEVGIFACGDCRKKNLYQVITAAGDGAVAADSAHKYLMSLS